MKAETKNKIKDWFIITRIRILNFIKEHKYVSAVVGVFLMSLVIALVVKAATENTVNSATVRVDEITVSTGEENNEVKTFSEAIYTIQYKLVDENQCSVQDTVLYADEVTITATLPESTDTKNIKWISNEETVEASISADNRTLTIKDKDVNMCSTQHQNLSLQILNAKKTNIKPIITITGGSNGTSIEASADNVPQISVTYDEELTLKAKLRPGIAKFVSPTERNANFGILVGVDSSTELTSLKGKHLSDELDVYLLASQATSAGEKNEYLDILTDEGTYGPYEHNRLHYFTNSNVPDLNTLSSTIKSFAKLVSFAESDFSLINPETVTVPIVTLTNANTEEIIFERYPEEVSYIDDSKLKIGDGSEVTCNGTNCEILMYDLNSEDKNSTIDDINLDEVGSYEIRYKVGNDTSTTMIKKISVTDELQSNYYSLEGPKTHYVLKDTSDDATYNSYGVYDITNKKLLSSNDYKVVYYDKTRNEYVTEKQMLSTPGKYTQKYTITRQVENSNSSTTSDTGEENTDGEQTDGNTTPEEPTNTTETINIKRTIIVVDEMPSITSDTVSVTDSVISKGTAFTEQNLMVNGKSTSCNSDNNCSYEPTTIDTSVIGDQFITYTITNDKGFITSIVKKVTVTPTYYKLSLQNLLSNTNLTRIDNGNFYALASYYVTVPSTRTQGDNADYNIKLEAFDKTSLVDTAIALSRANSTGKSTSKLENVFYVNENSSMVPVTDSQKSGLTGNYSTAAMGEEVEMVSTFEYGYDADTNVDELTIKIPVNPNLLPIGYNSENQNYYYLKATYNGNEINALPIASIQYCKTSDEEDCFEPTPENYANENIVIHHINITLKENTYKEQNGAGEEVAKTFDIKPGTVIELRTKYKVRTFDATSSDANDLSNLKFSGNITFSWTNTTSKEEISITSNSTPDIYITPYKARTSVGIGQGNNFNYSSITLDASKNDVYTVYATTDVVSPAMNIQSNIFGYSKIASLPIIFRLPEGVNYVYNKDYTYTPIISYEGNQTILTYNLNNIEPNSWIEPIYFDFTVDVTKAKSTLTTGETGFVLTTYTGNPNNLDKSINNDVSSIDYKKTTTNIVRIENTEYVSYGQYIYSHGKSVTNIDLNDDFEFITKLHNNGTTFVSDISVFTVLPYVDTESGATYNGTYQVTDLPKNAYCTVDDPSMVTKEDQVENINWEECSKFLTEEGTYANITAYRVDYDNLASAGNIETTSSITTIGNKPDDSYKFKSYLMYKKSNGTSSGYINFKDITLDVVSKKITGVVWEDFDADGIMDADEKKLDNVTLKLYDENDTLLEPTITPDENGIYTFSAVPEGNYYIVAEFNTDKYGVTGAPSEDFYDQTRLSVFREATISNEDIEENDSSDEDEEETESSEEENSEEQRTMNIVKTDLITIGPETRIVRNINLGLSLRKKFEVQVNKYITRAEVTNALGVVTRKDYGNTKLAKLDVKDINNLKIKVVYSLELQNIKYYPGYVNLVTEQVPDGMSFNPEYSENQGWELQSDGSLINRSLSDTLIYENEKQYLTVAFDITRKEAGSFVNFASVDELEIFGGGQSE